uniref:Na+/dicarboxylate na+/tricarboxylate and phosphate transporter n=1 Tax=Heterorhabditis bacteriophora TaxID=37862 RepID=A0A1I7XPU8_HETBA
MGMKYMLNILNKSTEDEKKDEEYVKKAVFSAYTDLGPMTLSGVHYLFLKSHSVKAFQRYYNYGNYRFAEKSTLGIFVFTVASWISSDPKVFPGWANLFKKGYVTDSCSGMVAVFLLFVWPKEMPDFAFLRRKEERLRPSVKRDALLSWNTVRQRFPWSIILLLGAGFAISKSVKESGLSSLIACNMESLLAGFPPFVMQIVISLIVVIMTEFSTNSATASIFIPIAFNTAESVRVHPLYFSIPTAIGPSFSFMLPMATPPNAIVYETNTIRMIDMPLVQSGAPECTINLLIRDVTVCVRQLLLLACRDQHLLKMLLIVYLSALIPTYLALGRTQSTAVEGVLMCDNKLARNILVKMFEHDTVTPDELMDSAETDDHGKFRLSGSAEEV